ncbi:hypothetical protein K440DRAFT_552643 [Wilcoxina mikolae CBS 423.85]|nr:hypothetical protein K440DRAFT_552643 [Wilcoxina mikolae CBS 423.85]
MDQPWLKPLILLRFLPTAAASSLLNFPKNPQSIQLDIVGLLAIVGESAMSGHVQPATASFTALLPRFLPAPQSFLTTTRPWRLPPNTASSVVGICSGNLSQTLNFFPDILHGIDELPRFSIRVISITRPFRGDEGYIKNIKVRRFGPMNMLAVIGMVLFIGLLVEAIVLDDGMAVLAVLFLGVTSSMVGLGSLWSVDLPRRKDNRAVPSGDVVVLGRQGAFLVVRCNEDIARELYFGQERCNYYMGERAFQVIAASATFMFMASVVFLANCTWNLQASIGLSYITLNGLYWIAALIPSRMQWDLGAYEVIDEEMTTAATYTDTLVKVIKVTRETGWIKRGRAVPETEAWDSWLKEAGESIMDAKWDGRECLTRLMGNAPSTTVGWVHV